MRSGVIIFAVLLSMTSAVFAWKDIDIEQLKSRVQSARVEELPSLCTQIAKKQAESADNLYKEGKVDEARAAVDDIVNYSDKARDAAIRSGKKVKDTEIAVRKMAEKLRSIKRTLAFEDQAPVQSAIDRLEQMRTDLFDRMFGKKQK
jgi:polyhydroxyalkanoate synthesis regulator phasin